MISVAFVLNLVLQLADGWTTYKCLSTGVGTEANPIVDKLLKAVGVIPGLIIIKSFGAFLAVYLYSVESVFLWPLAVLYAYVVHSNYKILKGDS